MPAYPVYLIGLLILGVIIFTGIPPDWSKPEFRELFTRWFQFGTFCPIFRIHGKGERALFSKNWAEKTRSILLHFDNLRYRLLPYIYSLAGKVTNDNYTNDLIKISGYI